MTTEADEKIEDARKNIELAYKNIVVALNSDTWGSDNYRSHYIICLHQSLTKLLEIKDLLG